MGGVVGVVVVGLLMEICSGHCGGFRSPCLDLVPSSLCLDHDHLIAHHHHHRHHIYVVSYYVSFQNMQQHQQVDDHDVMVAVVLVLVVAASVGRH